MTDRRGLLRAAGAAAASLALAGQAASAAGKANVPVARSGRSKAFARKLGPRIRVMIANDLSGDLDGLFATVHALLSTSAEVRGIVGTAALQPSETSQRSVELANEILRIMGLTGKIPVHLGAERRMAGPSTPVDCPGARAIVAEAMRDDPRPLYVTVGGGLTEVASALLLEPSIAERFTLVWIGGDPHDEADGTEYNLNLDRKAAQIVFNDSHVPLWQVTSKGYGTCQISSTEIQAYVAPYGAIGAWLYARIVEGYPGLERYGVNAGETWTLGDSPLVLLTALTSWVPSSQSRPLKYERTSSPFDEVFVPRLRDDGRYEGRTQGRKMRVFNSVDTRLMFGDFFAKMRMNYGP
jgi:purine nucleosidase